MIEPGQLFDADVAHAAKIEAMNRVDAHAVESWKRAARISIQEVARRRPEFTTDAVWWWLDHHYPDEITPEPRAMGPLMRWAVSKGIVARTDRTSLSQRAVCHQRPLSVWTSRVVE